MRIIQECNPSPFHKIEHIKQGRVVIVFTSPLDIARKIIKKHFEDVESMEPLAHLSKAIHGLVSVLRVAICLIAICCIAICRVTISRWVLHALIIGVANQPNNQLIVGSALLDKAEEGLCGDLMVACGDGSGCEMDGGGPIAMDGGGAIGQRQMGGTR